MFLKLKKKNEKPFVEIMFFLDIFQTENLINYFISELLIFGRNFLMFFL